MSSRNAELLERASAVIPWATQVNAKRANPILGDALPFFIERAEGCRVVDADGREYIDYISSLGPVILGYRYPAVDSAVRAQMDKGSLFSMNSELEVQLAEAIRDTVPGAEMVRFLKTGGDALAACVRLARAITGRDYIVITGYHGWHDAFASPRSAGVPEAVRSLTIRCQTGDVAQLTRIFAEHPDQIAAVVTEYPYREDDPRGDRRSDGGRGGDGVTNFVRTARELTAASGALLILDEVLSGFRLAPGGGAEYYGIRPDLAVYAKALANGYPLATFVGKAEHMRLGLDRTLVSTTYASETLSMAAALATLRTMREEPVHAHIWERGRELMAGLAEIARENGLPVTIAGLPPIFTLELTSGNAELDRKLYSAFYGGLLRRGVLCVRQWLTNYSHSRSDVEETLEAAAAAGRDAAAALG